jgi:hypothetical protein
MGLETTTTVHHRGASWTAKVLLETDELRVRGARPLRVRFAEITKVDVADGSLVVEWGGHALRVALGAAAAKWAERIRNPRTLLDKLGVKAGAEAVVVGDVDAALCAELASRTSLRAVRAAASVPKGAALVFHQADDAGALDALATIEARMARDGALWVVHPKGKGGLADTVIFAAAAAAGLAAVKVARVSETLTAEKLVIPRDRR